MPYDWFYPPDISCPESAHFYNALTNDKNSFQPDDSILPNAREPKYLSDHWACDHSVLWTISPNSTSGWRKGSSKVWVKKDSLLLVKNFPPGIIIRCSCTWLSFSEIWKDKFTGNARSLACFPVGFRVSLQHPFRMWQYCAMWYITLTGPLRSIDKEWHLPSKPQTALVQLASRKEASHYFRTRAKIRRKKKWLSWYTGLSHCEFKADPEPVTSRVSYFCEWDASFNPKSSEKCTHVWNIHTCKILATILGIHGPLTSQWTLEQKLHTWPTLKNFSLRYQSFTQARPPFSLTTFKNKSLNKNFIIITWGKMKPKANLKTKQKIRTSFSLPSPFQWVGATHGSPMYLNAASFDLQPGFNTVASPPQPSPSQNKKARPLKLARCLSDSFI